MSLTKNTGWSHTGTGGPMNKNETVNLLERVRKQHVPTWSPEYGHRCSCGDMYGSLDERAFDRHVAEMQAAALAEAAEGTITISTEGLPSREALRSHAASLYEGAPVRVTLARVAEAMPEPTPPLPTAMWSVVTDREGAAWVLRGDGRWWSGTRFPRRPEELVAHFGPITVRHDAGADQ